MKVPQRDSIFTHSRPILSVSMFVLAALILYGLSIIERVNNGTIEKFGAAQPTPTRTDLSFSGEGDAYFISGDLNAAILAYQDALTVNPDSVEALIQLSRMQAYSSSLLTAERKINRLQQALDNINRAVEIDEFNSDAHAIRAFVLDWNAGVALSIEEREAFLIEAGRAANLAVNLNNQSGLATAYRAEILADQQQFSQALQAA
ncbi:MAG: tetratricopeptide repeat protein, partial [Chloroflexota bacterium]